MKVAFLDRDGVINREVSYLHRIEDFNYTERCIDGLRNLIALGFEIVVVTNQAGIARGYYTELDYQNLTDFYRSDLASQGIELLDILHCPHHPDGNVEQYRKKCDCRKPQPEMIFRAAEIYSISLEESVLIGDKVSDAQAGERAGVGRVILVESGHALNADSYLRYETTKNLYEASCLLGQ